MQTQRAKLQIYRYSTPYDRYSFNSCLRSRYLDYQPIWLKNRP
jgi:hypothetical protein